MSHHALFLTIGVYAVIAGITTVIASMNGHAEVAVIAGWVAKLFTIVFLLYLAASLLSARLGRRQRRNRQRTSKNLA
jgi:membrane protein implicated in regulation of membrane protease activity